MTLPALTSYDEVIYPGNPIPQTHPDRLATLAHLFGMRPMPASRCRLLELGCGVGGNIAAMAYAWPDSEFVGIDLSARSVEIAKRNITELGLRNARVLEMSIADITPEFGTFDYITAHGVYSWVPSFVREKMLATFRDNLAPQGVAYASYNAYPGSHFRNAARDMMRFHVRTMGDPQQKVAEGRAIIKVLTELIPPEETYCRVLREQLDRLERMSDEVVFHDDLDPDATPFLLHEVVEAAERHGLQYLSEASFAQTHLGVLPDYIKRVLDRFPVSAVLEREQYLDFFAARSFRQTLFCRREVELRTEIRPGQIRDYYVAAPLVPESEGRAEDGAARFKTPRDVPLSTKRALSKAAFEVLGTIWPEGIAFPDLVEAARLRLASERDGSRTDVEVDVDALEQELFRAFATDQIEATLYPPRLTTTISPRPEASLLARKLAEGSALVTNMRHKRVRMEDELARRFLVLVDGTKDVKALHAELRTAAAQAAAEGGVPPPDITRESVEHNLRLLAALGLLVA